MIIKPKVRGFMCVTSHPAGCEANVKAQIDYVKAQDAIEGAPKKVLVIGASTGYGLASRITAAFGCGAATLGLFFEKEGSEKRPGSAGWYNSAAFHKFAEQEGIYAKSINGDAFSDALKEKAINTIKEDLGQIDLVIYSLASPRREHPVSGELHKSTLKPIGKAVTATTLDTDKKVVKEVSLEAASQQEIDDTVAVMGGEDWSMWIEALAKAGVLAENCKTTAYTYIGDKITWDIYWDGTIGAAKRDLDERVVKINDTLSGLNGSAYVSVLKALVTQSSSAIPIMPLYLSLLFKVMKEKGGHEGCIEQVYGLFKERLYVENPETDDANRLRMDGKELRAEIQQAVEELWPQVRTDNIDELTDFKAYQEEFLKLFGFGFDSVDYEADISSIVNIKALV